MNRKRTLILSLSMMALAVILIAGVGTSYAQGPRQGNGRSGWAAQANQNNMTGTAYGYGQNNAQGLNLQQQLHDPLLQGAASGFQQRRGAAGQGQGQYIAQQGNGGYGINPYLTMEPFDGELPTEVVAALVAGLTDEYNAYHMYSAAIAQFGPIAPFTAIQQAEASHAAALERAFTYYGLDVPAIAPLNTDKQFYSLEDACTLAAEAEVANFALYDQWLEAVSDYPDLVQIFTALRNASEFNHLPALQSCAATAG